MNSLVYKDQDIYNWKMFIGMEYINKYNLGVKLSYSKNPTNFEFHKAWTSYSEEYGA